MVTFIMDHFFGSYIDVTNYSGILNNQLKKAYFYANNGPLISFHIINTLANYVFMSHERISIPLWCIDT